MQRYIQEQIQDLGADLQLLAQVVINNIEIFAAICISFYNRQKAKLANGFEVLLYLALALWLSGLFFAPSVGLLAFLQTLCLNNPIVFFSGILGLGFISKIVDKINVVKKNTYLIFPFIVSCLFKVGIAYTLYLSLANEGPPDLFACIGMVGVWQAIVYIKNEATKLLQSAVKTLIADNELTQGKRKILLSEIKKYIRCGADIDSISKADKLMIVVLLIRNNEDKFTAFMTECRQMYDEMERKSRVVVSVAGDICNGDVGAAVRRAGGSGVVALSAFRLGAALLRMGLSDNANNNDSQNTLYRFFNNQAEEVKTRVIQKFYNAISAIESNDDVQVGVALGVNFSQESCKNLLLDGTFWLDLASKCADILASTGGDIIGAVIKIQSGPVVASVAAAAPISPVAAVRVIDLGDASSEDSENDGLTAGVARRQERSAGL